MFLFCQVLKLVLVVLLVTRRLGPSAIEKFIPYTRLCVQYFLCYIILAQKFVFAGIKKTKKEQSKFSIQAWLAKSIEYSVAQKTCQMKEQQYRMYYILYSNLNSVKITYNALRCNRYPQWLVIRFVQCIHKRRHHVRMVHI